MSDHQSTQAEETADKNQNKAMKINIKMQQGEHTGQPIYSNFTAVQSGQGVVLVDFGFLDPQTINVLNRMAQSGEQAQEQKTVNARMSCRIAISPEAAGQLTRQLSQLLQNARKAGEQSQPQ